MATKHKQRYNREKAKTFLKNRQKETKTQILRYLKKFKNYLFPAIKSTEKKSLKVVMF